MNSQLQEQLMPLHNKGTTTGNMMNPGVGIKRDMTTCMTTCTPPHTHMHMNV